MRRRRPGRALAGRGILAALLAALACAAPALGEDGPAPGAAHAPDDAVLPLVSDDTAAEVRRAAQGPSDSPAPDPGEEEAVEAGETGEAEPWPTTRPPMPFEIVRSLQFLQDQIARGNVSAMRAQGVVLDRFAPAFLSADPSVWRDARNLRAAILFTLSGGPPSVLRGIEARGTVGEAERPLVAAALAYVENRGGSAAETLSAIDVDGLEPALAAQMSLARAQILEVSDPARALADLDRVRLLMPGTLLEEAALRMGVPIAETLGLTAKADALARRYFDRYARSAYAGNFRARFAAAFAERAETAGVSVIKAIRDATHPLPDDERLEIFLSVARRALVRGNEALAAAIAEDALALADLPQDARERAKLYMAAATLAARTVSEARALLAAVDAASLHPADREILDAALKVVDGMAAPALSANASMPAVPPAADALAGGTETPAEQTPAAFADSAVLARGALLLDDISYDLENANR